MAEFGLHGQAVPGGVNDSVSMDLLKGAYMVGVTSSDTEGTLEFSFQSATGAQGTLAVGGTLLINAAPSQEPDAETAFNNNRVWWDRVTLRRPARVPGHNLQVAWPEYANVLYREERHFPPDNFLENEYYYNLDAHQFVYRILQNGVLRNIGGFPPGWVGPVRNQAAAEALVSANNQLFEWGENVRRSSGYAAPTNSVFYWESVFGDPNELTEGEVRDSASEVQGTVSGQRLSQAVNEYGGLTVSERHDLHSIPALIALTTDLRVKVLARNWEDVSDVSLGGFASEGAGNLGPIHAAALVYVTSKVGTLADAENDYVYVRIPSSRDIRHFRIRQDGSLGEFFISSWNHLGAHEDFDYYRSRHNLFEGYSITIQYDTVTAFQTGYEGTLDSLHELEADEANDGSSDVFGVVSGRRVAGAIDAHHTTQYTWLTELRLDYREPQASVEPQFHILIVGGESTHDRILEFSHLTDEDAAFIRSIQLDTIVNVAGSFFNVFAYAPSGTDLGLQGVFNIDPVLVDEQSYRLRFNSPRPVPDEAGEISVDRTNLDGNLAGVPGNAQAMFEAVDDFTLGSGGASNWGALAGRPNRPTSDELIAGINTDEAVASVSDIVSLVNNHRLVRSNTIPANIGNVAVEGDGAQVSRYNHGHRFPHDSTLYYDDANAQFGVSIHDVIEHLQESIWYYTTAPYDYSQGGGPSEGQIYATSPFDKRITRVRIRFVPVPGTRYEARIASVDNNRQIQTRLGTSQFRTPSTGGSHHFDFNSNPVSGEAGILIPGGTRIMIVLSRLGGGNAGTNRGDESGNSPTKSYDDAGQDFFLRSSVVYNQENPDVGDDSHSHGDENDIRGNIQIVYSLTYNHGRFVGDNFDLSDAVPQPSTTDGSAGDSEEASRANHAHPDRGSGGELSGNTIEVLFDNRASTETALGIAAGTGHSVRSADAQLTRVLAAADDVMDLRCGFIYTQDGEIRSFDMVVNAGVFRNFVASNDGLSTDLPTGGYHIFAVVDGRSARTFTSLFGRAGLLVRGEVGGVDVARLYFNLTSNAAVAITEMRGIIELVPRIDALMGGGSSQQQQAGGGRILRTRSIAAPDTLIAANNLSFDITAVGGQIALGRYAVAPTPIADIFDMVATIRVGSRAGFPITLSHEQLEYVGEYDLQDTWPFGGDGGITFGNVTELPCAMLTVHHVSEGIVKAVTRPQRQQIGWTIGGSFTAILFFFTYDAANENVIFVEVIVFTDQVIEIEGMHFHYWENA